MHSKQTDKQRIVRSQNDLADANDSLRQYKHAVTKTKTRKNSDYAEFPDIVYDSRCMTENHQLVAGRFISGEKVFDCLCTKHDDYHINDPPRNTKTKASKQKFMKICFDKLNVIFRMSTKLIKCKLCSFVKNFEFNDFFKIKYNITGYDSESASDILNKMFEHSSNKLELKKKIKQKFKDVHNNAIKNDNVLFSENEIKLILNAKKSTHTRTKSKKIRKSKKKTETKIRKSKKKTGTKIRKFKKKTGTKIQRYSTTWNAEFDNSSTSRHPAEPDLCLLCICEWATTHTGKLFGDSDSTIMSRLRCICDRNCIFCVDNGKGVCCEQKKCRHCNKEVDRLLLQYRFAQAEREEANQAKVALAEREEALAEREEALHRAKVAFAKQEEAFCQEFFRFHAFRAGATDSRVVGDRVEPIVHVPSMKMSDDCSGVSDHDRGQATNRRN